MWTYFNLSLCEGLKDLCVLFGQCLLIWLHTFVLRSEAFESSSFDWLACDLKSSTSLVNDAILLSVSDFSLLAASRSLSRREILESYSSRFFSRRLIVESDSSRLLSRSFILESDSSSFDRNSPVYMNSPCSESSIHAYFEPKSRFSKKTLRWHIELLPEVTSEVIITGLAHKAHIRSNEWQETNSSLHQILSPYTIYLSLQPILNYDVKPTDQCRTKIGCWFLLNKFQALDLHYTRTEDPSSLLEKMKPLEKCQRGSLAPSVYLVIVFDFFRLAALQFLDKLLKAL